MLACGGSLPEGANVLATIDHLMRDAISGGQSQSAAISRSRGPRPISRNLSNQRPSTAINSKR